MALQYRTFFQDDRDSLLASVFSCWNEWLEEKGLPVLTGMNDEATGDHRTARAQHDSDTGCEALRLTLTEDRPDSLWTTTVAAIHCQGEQWVWVDVDMVRDDAFSKPPDVAAPRIVRTLISNGSATMGKAFLRDTSFEAKSHEDADTLWQLLCHPDRAVPLVVFSWRPGENEASGIDRAQRTARRLAGIANTWLLAREATNAFIEIAGRDMAVFNGAVRTYLPGIDQADPQPWNHRYTQWERFRHHSDAAARIVGSRLMRQLAARRPPEVYREAVSKLPSFATQRHDRDSESLLEELVRYEERYRLASEELDRAQDELELNILELDETTQRLAKAQQRVAWLENKLAESGDETRGVEPDEGVPAVADGCEHALEMAQQHLPYIAIPKEVFAAVADLDQYPKGGTWGQRAWEALRALNEYAERKSAKEPGDFSTMLEGKLQQKIPRGWWTPHESATTSQNRSFRDARTLPVDDGVHRSGSVYMPAHVKIEPGGRPAPRIHVYDDTGGRTGKVHVGYFGVHLPNQQTN